MKQFRGGLVSKVQRLLYHSTLGSRGMKKKKKKKERACGSPNAELRANIRSISHRCHPILVAFVWQLTKETIDLPLGCLQGGEGGWTSSIISTRTGSWVTYFFWFPEPNIGRAGVSDLLEGQPANAMVRFLLNPTPCTLQCTPFTLHSIPYTLHSIP